MVHMRNTAKISRSLTGGMIIVMLLAVLMLPIAAGNAYESPSGMAVNSTLAASGLIYGDCNNDTNVDALDFALFKKYLMEPEQPYIEYMDLNIDKTVDSVDYAILKKFLLGGIASLPYVSDPVNPGVLLVGRFDTSDPAGPKFAWSTSAIKANFQGTGISVTLKSTGDNWFNVILDGRVLAPVNVPAGSSSPVVLASGLTNGSHTIELVRRTEAWLGEVQFLGFNVSGGSLLAPPAPSARRIEFIGDSITCGYGNEGTSQYQSFTPKNENAYLAYGAMTARLLGADPVTVCWSGKGVVRNYGGDTSELMPALYQRILPYSATPAWDAGKWTPQVAVINLGTNDFSVGIPDKAAFTAAYSAFVGKLRSQYPQAHIYCAMGPMLNGDNLTSARDFINTVVTQKNSAGDGKVHYIEFPMQDASNGYGEDWHPSVKTHELMANQLAAAIRKDLGW